MFIMWLCHSITDLVLEELAVLNSKVDEVIENQTVLKTIIQVNKATIYAGQKKFEVQFNFYLPFKIIQEFNDFDLQVSTNEACCNRFVSYALYSLISLVHITDIFYINKIIFFRKLIWI